MICKNCGQPIDVQDKFCGTCGIKAETENAQTRYCSSCGAVCSEKDSYCSCCGKALDSKQAKVDNFNGTGIRPSIQSYPPREYSQKALIRTALQMLCEMIVFMECLLVLGLLFDILKNFKFSYLLHYFSRPRYDGSSGYNHFFGTSEYSINMWIVLISVVILEKIRGLISKQISKISLHLGQYKPSGFSKLVNNIYEYILKQAEEGRK